MRKFILILIFILISSCTKNGSSEDHLAFSLTDLPQTWRLTAIGTGLSGKIVDPEDIAVREIYIFEDDGIVSKQFKDESTEGLIRGTYEIVADGENEYLILTYQDGIDSLSYCSRDNIENMLISEDGRTLSNFICSTFDGPSMGYRRTE